jgi:N6-L-threonylcarbamoyladenine synthase
MNKDITILAIESSCDDTSAAVIRNGEILSNCIAGQKVHEEYGGVVPEIASRAHQANIVPVVDLALKKAGIKPTELTAIAFTRGPGLLGSLLVGVSFAKAMALSLDIPLIEVNHIQAHVLSHFIEVPRPALPFLCLTVSGGHTQILLIRDYLDMQELGTTIDDAAGEAFDKIGKIMGLGYPAGPIIDKMALEGKPIFEFSEPQVQGFDFSFSGLKTNVLRFLQKETKLNSNFINENLSDLCASIQSRIVSILMNKLQKAVLETGVKEVAIAGGVSANSGLRKALENSGNKLGWNTYIPAFQYCTDNAAMIAMTAHFKYLKNEFSGQDTVPLARYEF